jgi:hypothetical protein
MGSNWPVCTHFRLDGAAKPRHSAGAASDTLKVHSIGVNLVSGGVAVTRRSHPVTPPTDNRSQEHRAMARRLTARRFLGPDIAQRDRAVKDQAVRRQVGRRISRR